jgi:hypothetical protein
MSRRRSSGEQEAVSGEMGGRRFRRAVPGQNGRITGTRDQPVAFGPAVIFAPASQPVVRHRSPQPKVIAFTAAYHQRHCFGTCRAVVIGEMLTAPATGDPRERTAARRAARMMMPARSR